MFRESAAWDEGLLAVARRRLPGMRLTRADMADFDLGRRFDAVTCLFSSVGYLGTVERLRAAVLAMARHLEPGGVRVIVSRRDGAMSVLRFHYAVAADGDIATADERHELRLFTHGEYAAAFLEAGWTRPGTPRA